MSHLKKLRMILNQKKISDRIEAESEVFFEGFSVFRLRGFPREPEEAFRDYLLCGT